jgi:hypothetical protein
MRVPQYPQKGSPLSAGLVHRGQRVGAVGARSGVPSQPATVVAGAAAMAGAAGTAARGTAGVVGIVAEAELSPPGLPAPLRAPTCAAEAVIGFPQSMQNREVVSFSRPQNEQRVNRHPPRRESSWRANIGSISTIRTGDAQSCHPERSEESALRPSPIAHRPPFTRDSPYPNVRQCVSRLCCFCSPPWRARPLPLQPSLRLPPPRPLPRTRRTVPSATRRPRRLPCRRCLS